MKLVENYIIPFRGYKCLTIWPFVFMRKGYFYNSVDRHHESIHGEQQKEVLPFAIAICAILYVSGCGWWSLLALPLWFYWYVTEWIVRLIAYGNQWEAYRNISFEQEAFTHERDFGTDYYLPKRKHFAWLGFVGRKTILKNNK